MKARIKATEKEQVLVRHVTAEKRNDIQHLEPLLKAPFPSESSSTSDGRSKDVSILGYASGRCLVAARFAKQPWAPLYSNAASAQELFEANAGSRRLEVVWLGCKPDDGLVFQVESCRQNDCRLRAAARRRFPCALEVERRGAQGAQARRIRRASGGSPCQTL